MVKTAWRGRGKRSRRSRLAVNLYGTDTEPSTSHVSELPDEPIQVEGHATDETGNSSKTDMQLHPDGLWFHEPSVVANVTKSIKSCYDGPYTCWSNTPAYVREKWWFAFRELYSWDASIADQVKKGFEKKLKKRLPDVIHKLRKSEKEVKWCLPKVRAALRQLEETKEFKKRSEQASKNKKCSVAIHVQGSVSTEAIRRKLAKETGKEPTAAEVFKHTHQRKNQFVDQKSREVWETFEMLQEMYHGDESIENPPSESELFLRAAGGWSQKRNVYGIGSAATSYYEAPPSGRGSQSIRIHELENEVQALREQVSEIHTLREQVSGLTSQLRDYDAYKSQVHTLSQLLSGSNWASAPCGGGAGGGRGRGRGGAGGRRPRQ